MSSPQHQPVTHELKIWTTFYEPLASGLKPFEVRRNDRHPRFEVGDILRLREWRVGAQEYTGRECLRTIAYILAGGQFGIEQGYVVLGFEPQPAPHRNQYDELIHFVQWLAEADPVVGLRPMAPSPEAVAAYCRAFSIPMPAGA
ncbi:MAG: ASCH/PUA domain-containing protein [Flavobacteriales bacterium]|nr:MAG: ASCH/PUA domain-containing protein [Flavobacteriales bacterium]